MVAGPKYKSLRELADAVDKVPTGTLYLDNDYADMYDDETGEVLLYTAHPYTLLREALDLLGIPWENA